MASSESENQSKAHTFKLHVGIDFGTDGSGTQCYIRFLSSSAITLILEQQQDSHTRFPMAMSSSTTSGNQRNTAQSQSQKLKSCSTKKENALHSASMQATFILNSTQRHSKSGCCSKDSKWQEKQDEDEQKQVVIENGNKHKINIKKELVAMNGKTYPSQKVFVEALKYLKTEVTQLLIFFNFFGTFSTRFAFSKKAQKYFRKLKVGKPKDSEIQWVCLSQIPWLPLCHFAYFLVACLSDFDSSGYLERLCQESDERVVNCRRFSRSKY